MQLQLEEVRRLTGPNILWDHPGALVDVLIDGADKLAVVKTWQRWMEKLLAEFDWQQSTTFRLHTHGASMALSAPMDSLYTACELAELGWECCAAQMQGNVLPEWDMRLRELHGELAEESNPELIELMTLAAEQQVSCISDDDEVSLGMGGSVDVWPARELPNPDTLDWQPYRDIPRAFVTGTNGKSTSVRLAAQIAKAAGICAGVTSTDFIRVGDEIIDTGDYSGPGGARMLLRDKRTEMAFLEVARGGLLRRGLPVETVDAALITNVASDHLGQYGINTVEELALTKFLVAKGLKEDAVLILNADNEPVVEQSLHIDKTVCWFSTDENHSLIQQQIASGERAVFVREDTIVYHHKGQFESISTLANIPMTFNGAAIHNVQNALGVVGLCKALNLPVEAIQSGLKSFGSNAEDNPGRGNIYEIADYKVVVDFAHNEHSMRAIVDTVRKLPANRYTVMFGHAGDRSDQEIEDLTCAVMELEPQLFIVSEVEKYLRGRELGAIPDVVRKYLVANGVSKEKLQVASNPLEGTKLATRFAQSGDILLLFVLDDREIVHNYLSGLAVTTD
jgi:cyanophycin synthetase